MNAVDIGIILILISYLAMGSKKGAIKEAISFIGIIIVLIASFMLKNLAGHYLCLYFPFLEFKGTALEGIPAFNIFMYQILAFLGVFGILLGFYAILVKGSELVQKLVNMTIILVPVSKVIGAIISGIKCWLILFVILVALSIPLGSKEQFQKSKLTNAIIYKTPIVSQFASSFTNSLKEVYEVVDSVENTKSAKKLDKKKKEANLACIEIMLKYKFVNKETVQECRNAGKLPKQDGLDELLK